MKCWNCGLETMWPSKDLDKGWFKCSDCGATWSEIPEPGQNALGGIWKDKGGISHYHSVTPKKRKKAKK